MKQFNQYKVGQMFRIAGYDDLLEKINETTAKSHGCGFLNKPTRLVRKGGTVKIKPTEKI